MNIFIRTDASFQIGTGHVMRCLTLADALRVHGASVSFICRVLPGYLGDFIRSRGFTVHEILDDASCTAQNKDDWAYIAEAWSEDADSTCNTLKTVSRVDWLIVDQYALDVSWEQKVRQGNMRIMVVDDKADRPHDCDILLDQNFYMNASMRYKHLIKRKSIYLLGPRYALLREQFRIARKNLKRRNDGIKNIFVSYGGVDATNETCKLLHAARMLNAATWHFDVVLGSASIHKAEVERICAVMPNVDLHCQVNDMAPLMAHADVAFGAGGMTTWERCVLGIPSFVTIVADNQIESAEALVEYGAIQCVGRAENITEADYARVLASIEPTVCCKMSRNGMELVDGLGCERVVARLVTF